MELMQEFEVNGKENQNHQQGETLLTKERFIYYIKSSVSKALEFLAWKM